MRVTLTARRSKQSLLQEINPGYSLEGLMLKLQYLGHLMQRAHSLEKTLMLGKIEGGREGVAMDETLGWHHRFDGHEFEQIVRQWRTEEPGALLSTGSQRRTEPSDQTTTTDRGRGVFPGGSDGKEPACNARDPDWIPGSGRTPGEENGCPLQDSCVENPMDREAWWATVCGVAKCQTRLSD